MQGVRKAYATVSALPIRKGRPLEKHTIVTNHKCKNCVPGAFLGPCICLVLCEETQGKKTPPSQGELDMGQFSWGRDSIAFSYTRSPNGEDKRGNGVGSRGCKE